MEKLRAKLKLRAVLWEESSAAQQEIACTSLKFAASNQPREESLTRARGSGCSVAHRAVRALSLQV